MKKLIAMILCMTMLGGLMSAFPFSAVEETNPAPSGDAVTSVEEFLAMDPNGVYYLANDIDFSGTTYTKNLYTKTFTGVLDGNGHKLLGITVTATNSDAGIFANSFRGTLKNLTIGTEDDPAMVSSTGSGMSVAAIAGTMTGGATFENVTIYADVRGEGKTAGFTSYMPNGKITIKNCAVHGNITGNPAAGFITMSNGGSCDIEIRDSANYATVSANNLSAGGFYTISADVNGSRHTTLVITGCVNFGAISATDWRVGGIVGEFNEEKTSTLLIDYCYNMGNITMKGGGGYAGGIVGGLGFDPPSGKREISNVFNVGEVRNNENTQRGYALCSGDKASANLTIKNGAYMEGCASNPEVHSNNVVATNIQTATDAASLLAIVSAYAESEEGNTFVADTGMTNGGYPILAREVTSHENVTTHACGRKVCEDCGAILSAPADEKHTYTEEPVAPDGYQDGYIVATCSACGATEIRKGTASQYQVTPVDGVYSFDSADDLKWYAANLNAGLLAGNEAIVLTADIDLGGSDFTPIGTKKNPYRGSFDGAFHTIKKLTVNSEAEGGLFGYVGMGAKLSNLALDTPVIHAVKSAGALFADASNAAVIKVQNIALVKATVTSTDGAAGSMIGSTAYASDVTVTAAVSNSATVTGGSAGGFIGDGNNTVMKSCYVNATLTSSGNATGSLAYHNGRFTEKYCGYVRNQMASVNDGGLARADDFGNGRIAYLINSYEGNFVFGLGDGVTTFTGDVIRMVRLGSKQIYTDKSLSPNGKVAVYATEKEGGVTAAIVIDPASKVRLVDLEIKVTDGGNTKTIAFADLDLNRYIAVGENYYTTENGMILYTVTLDGVSTSATYSIGTAFSGAATVIK